MQESKIELLDGVKTTVAQYGMTDFSTRKLADVAGVNNGLIYHYFDGVGDVLQQAYRRESEALLDELLRLLNETLEIAADFGTKVRLWFHKAWREFLADPDRVTFCSAYYDSAGAKGTEDFLKVWTKRLTDRIGACFRSETACIHTIFAISTLLYDSAKRVVDGVYPDTPETEESIFTLFFALLNAQSDFEAKS